MKKEFNKEYILDNRGCYSEEDVLKLSFINKATITINDLVDNLPIKDLIWFFVRKCELSELEQQLFALYCAKLVLHIYEDKYSNDNRVKDCITNTELYLNKQISSDEYLKSKNAAAAAYAAAAAADAADADAAAAAAYAADATYAAYAAAAAYAAYAAAAAAAAAAAYAADADFKASVKKYILEHQ